MERFAGPHFRVMGSAFSRFFSRSVFVALGVLVLNGCVQDASIDASADSSVVGSSANSLQNMFYASQEEADADLARFERENPSCQLWTNWQKMCSRTGVNGRVICVSDEDKTVRPSQPFCDRRSDPISGLSLADNPDEQQKLIEGEAARFSRNRFCVTYYSDDPQAYSFMLPGTADFSSIPFCVEFATNRPFNGVRGYLARHPACSEWSNFGHGLWHCIRPKQPAVCRNLTIGVSVPIRPSGPIAIGRNIWAESRPIWGLHCDHGR